jgi:hypothetical protein
MVSLAIDMRLILTDKNLFDFAFSEVRDKFITLNQDFQ